MFVSAPHLFFGLVGARPCGEGRGGSVRGDVIEDLVLPWCELGKWALLGTRRAGPANQVRSRSEKATPKTVWPVVAARTAVRMSVPSEPLSR